MNATGRLRTVRLRAVKLWLGRIRLSRLLGGLDRPPVAWMLIPALMLGAHGMFGDTGLYCVALTLPLLWALLTATLPPAPDPNLARHGPADSPRDALEHALQAILDTAPRGTGHTGSTACLLLAIDDIAALRDRHGMRGMDHIYQQVAQRVTAAMRDGDTISNFGDGRFGIVLAAVARADLESLLQITARLQRAIADPIVLSGTSVHLTASIGFSQPDRVPDATAIKLIETAEAALREAHGRGPGSVRAYSSELHHQRLLQSQLAEDVRNALEHGEIRPWFQPQISTDTGKVSGFEALARWQHPKRGVIAPGAFLPVLADAGLMERLGELMLTAALSALRCWDRAGILVPTVGVNFSAQELHNPNLVAKVAWELDRLDLSPERLSVEVLEDVIAHGPEDVVSRNITALSDLGCRIDLDDFGTGHASITNIRRFAVTRLKIDRSFVQRLHEDREQQRMVAAILTMAERLNLDTLAEGVESVGEHTMLAQLGCGHVQGFGISPPMPFDATMPWLQAHHAKLAHPPIIGRAGGATG